MNCKAIIEKDTLVIKVSFTTNNKNGFFIPLSDWIFSSIFNKIYCHVDQKFLFNEISVLNKSTFEIITSLDCDIDKTWTGMPLFLFCNYSDTGQIIIKKDIKQIKDSIIKNINEIDIKLDFAYSNHEQFKLMETMLEKKIGDKNLI